MDSLAIIERGHLYPTPASIHGVNAECPFCIARHIDKYRPNDYGVMFFQLHAGRRLKYFASDDDDAADSYEWLDRPGFPMRLMREHVLTLPIEVLTVP
ncbi:MAG: hypothetical protein ACR2FJ_03040, partial [Qipengyuania sp.]